MTFPKRILVGRSRTANHAARQARFGQIKTRRKCPWESLHYLSANGLGLNWRDLWESADAVEIRIDDCHELYAKSVSIIFKPIENLL